MKNQKHKIKCDNCGQPARLIRKSLALCEVCRADEATEELIRAEAALSAFVDSCCVDAEVTRLDRLAQVIDTLKHLHGDHPRVAGIAECEALLRDLRAACVTAGVVTEPAHEPLSSEEEAVETGRRG